MVEGKTSSGFKFNVDERALTDWRVVRALEDVVEEGNETQATKKMDFAMSIILGKDKEKLEQHVAKMNDGFVPAEKLMAEFTEIITSNKTIKNS